MTEKELSDLLAAELEFFAKTPEPTVTGVIRTSITLEQIRRIQKVYGEWEKARADRR